jgi:hypothetical protein
MEDQRRGLIVGIVGAVAEENPRASEPGRAARNELSHGDRAAFAPHVAARAPEARTRMK